MSDTPPRKTLSLARKGAAPAADPHGERRQRSGARARQVAQQERARKPGAEAAQAAPVPPARSRSPQPYRERPGAGRSVGQSAADTRSESTTIADPQLSSRPRIMRQARHHTPRAPQASETFQIFAPCPHGIEEALAAELQALEFDAVEMGRAGCHFRADWMGVLRANLYSRLATRILVQVSQGAVDTEDDILELARETEWERWFGAEQTLRVDTSALRSPMQSLQYCNLRAKDGICDRLREREGERPSIDTVRPDARVHLFLDAHQATLYLDVSGESLFKRGWRLDKGEAPLRENLAAGLLALSDWHPDAPLLDPFCGSGTILIEAAWIALGVPPGIWRPFGFERLRNHNARLWQDLKDDARSRIAAQLEQPLVGCDLSPEAIAAARTNAERAHLTADAVRFELGDARSFPPPAASGWIVTNPPYGERLQDEGPALWPEWATQLKQHFSDWQVNVITSDLDLPKQLRLKPQRRIPLYNGALDCRLFRFEMVADSYRTRS